MVQHSSTFSILLQNSAPSKHWLHYCTRQATHNLSKPRMFLYCILTEPFFDEFFSFISPSYSACLPRPSSVLFCYSCQRVIALVWISML